MLILSMYCITGSCIHVDNRNTASRIKKNRAIIVAVYTAEAVMALLISTLAMLGFFSIPGIKINISFTAKIIMITSGTSVLIVDTCYLVYRLEKASKENIKNFKREYNDVVDRINEKVLKIDSKLLEYQEDVRILNHEISILTKGFKEAKRVEQQQKDGNSDFTIEPKVLEKYEYNLQQSHITLQLVKDKIHDLLEIKEKLENCL